MRLMIDTFNHLHVSGYAEVAIVAIQFAVQDEVLLLHRQVPVFLAPLPEAVKRSGYPVFRGLALDRVVAFAALAPVVGKAEEIECPRFSALALSRWSELDKTRLVRVNR